ncbi:transcriptional regulator, AraC family [Pseudovibrio denitrificans]|uniref:Transcriptional regulator, AraC family n=1 Tax=Pseudovibrio denitrificans TaxID=258256 RepID=A0A1I6YHW2_9HYPH|nr:GyrI-like domain-containing protein [Pseudovibrio denitrificans]SFT49917.1 transcriptional regulator, AraC family [Pseudovibrio denitrificans]
MRHEALQKNIYTQRINRAMDYIERNICEELSLAQIADAACFSPYHFHRIFRAMTGETVNQFTSRLRVEKAARRLKQNPSISITDAALDMGFASPSTFARSFQARFGMPASQWRRDATASVEARANETMVLERPRSGLVADKVEVGKLEPRTVAYVRRTGNFQERPEIFGEAFGTLMAWAGPRGLAHGAEMMCLFHDDPQVTDAELMRFSSCLTLRGPADVEGEVGKMVVGGGRYACGHFVITHDQSQAAWEYMFGDWLPMSGYEPENIPCFQLYPSMTGEMGPHEVVICIPVRPLS